MSVKNDTVHVVSNRIEYYALERKNNKKHCRVVIVFNCLSFLLSKRVFYFNEMTSVAVVMTPKSADTQFTTDRRKRRNDKNDNILTKKLRATSKKKDKFVSKKLSPRRGQRDSRQDHSEGHAAYHSLSNGFRRGFYGYPVTEANCRRKRSCAVGSGRRRRRWRWWRRRRRRTDNFQETRRLRR